MCVYLRSQSHRRILPCAYLASFPASCLSLQVRPVQSSVIMIDADERYAQVNFCRLRELPIHYVFPSESDSSHSRR
jgi:hypothetical protein